MESDSPLQARLFDATSVRITPGDDVQCSKFVLMRTRVYIFTRKVGRPFAGAFVTLTVITLVCPRSFRRYQNILTGAATLTCVTADQRPQQARGPYLCWQCSPASGPAASLHDFSLVSSKAISYHTLYGYLYIYNVPLFVIVWF